MNIRIAGLSSLVLAAVLGGPSLLQAAPAKEAPAVTEDGYVVFAYADGWDKLSKKRVEKLRADAAVKAALGSAIVYSIAVPAAPDKARQKAFDEECQVAPKIKLKVGDASTYPAIHLYDRNGRRYTTIATPLVARGTAGEVAGLIREHMATGKEQGEIITKAARVGGKEKAGMLLATTRFEGFEWPEHVLNKVKQADPKDQSGAVRSLSFNGYGFAVDLRKKNVEEAMDEVDKCLADPAYSERQKQQICAAAIGYLRAKVGLPATPRIRRYAQRMKGYGCDTPETRAADVVLRDWTPVLTLKEGWTPATLPVDETPVEVEGDLGISKKGEYSVRFKYKKGRMALAILAVELYDGQLKIAEDRHKGSTGDKDVNNFYKLDVPRDVKDPHLFITVDMKKNRDSYGTISVTPM